ncbi:hypothetical protein MMC12_000369 [Toensbergia leucococca]|nr:hypothetical protein [Toensbergia leucococca]
MSQDSQPSQEASTDGSQSPFPPANWVQDIVAPLPDRAAAFRAGWQAGIESMKDDYANGFDDGYDAGGEDERINREEQLKELENQNEDGTDSSEDESETIISTDAMDLDTSNDIDAAPINTPIGPSVTNVAPTIPDTTHAASVRQVPGRIYGSRINHILGEPSSATTKAGAKIVSLNPLLNEPSSKGIIADVQRFQVPLYIGHARRIDQLVIVASVKGKPVFMCSRLVSERPGPEVKHKCDSHSDER